MKSVFQMLGRQDQLPVDWVIEDTVANWWRPNFEAPQVEFVVGVLLIEGIEHKIQNLK